MKPEQVYEIGWQTTLKCLSGGGKRSELCSPQEWTASWREQISLRRKVTKKWKLSSWREGAERRVHVCRAPKISTHADWGWFVYIKTTLSHLKKLLQLLRIQYKLTKKVCCEYVNGTDWQMIYSWEWKEYQFYDVNYLCKGMQQCWNDIRKSRPKNLLGHEIKETVGN